MIKRYLHIWESLSGWRLWLFYTLHYTIIFLLLQVCIFSDFYAAGKTFIWTNDGMPQHFTLVLTYINKIFKEGIQAFLNGDGWQFPLYNFNMGYIKTVFRTEPITLLAILWPGDKLDILYNWLVLLRYYLIGISFSIFGFYLKQKPLPILLGAISYTFCGFTIYAGVRHPFFMAFVIYLPLLLIGVEEVLRKRKPYIMIGMVFISLFTDVYFSCMLAILVVLYAFVRFWDLYIENRGREFAGMLCRLIIAGGTGVLLSAVTALPTLLQMLGTGRVGRDMSLLGSIVNYGSVYYQKFLGYFLIGPGDIGSWTCLGFVVLILPAIIALFVQHDPQKKSLRRFFILLTVMLCIRYVGYVFSGFNTYSNRWCFAYAFCVSVILMYMTPWFIECDNETYSKMSICCILYGVVCYFLIKPEYFYIQTLVLLATTLLLFTLCRSLKTDKKLWIEITMLGIVCLSVFYTSYLQYDVTQKNYIKEFTSQGMPYQYYANSQYASFTKSDVKQTDESFYRVSTTDITRQAINASFYYDINGVSGFPMSGFQAGYLDRIADLEIGNRSTLPLLIDYGTDGRAMQITPETIKYHVRRANSKEPIPYGFVEIEQIKNGKNTDIIYQNQYALPIGYTYDAYLNPKEYQTLTGAEKQEALMQAVLLDASLQSVTIAQKQPELLSRMSKPMIISAKGVSWKDGKLKVTEENATLQLSFVAVPNSETYVRMVNLNLTDGASTRRWNIKAGTDENIVSSSFCADAYIYTNGVKTQLLNLGYSKDGYTTCTLTFPQKGTVILDDIEIWYQPMDNYAKYVENLREESLENVAINWRGLTGTISVSKDKILCLAIPYESGWKAYVDGKRVDLYQANTAFMALELEEGDHVVELKYLPPAMEVGAAMTLVGIVSLVGIIIYNRKKR